MGKTEARIRIIETELPSLPHFIANCYYQIDQSRLLCYSLSVTGLASLLFYCEGSLAQENLC